MQEKGETPLDPYNPVPLEEDQEGNLWWGVPSGEIVVFSPYGSTLLKTRIPEGMEGLGAEGKKGTRWIVSSKGILYQVSLTSGTTPVEKDLPLAVGRGCLSGELLIFRDTQGGIYGWRPGKGFEFSLEGEKSSPIRLRGSALVDCSEEETIAGSVSGKVAYLRKGEFVWSDTYPDLQGVWGYRALFLPEGIWTCGKKRCVLFSREKTEPLQELPTGSADRPYPVKNGILIFGNDGKIKIFRNDGALIQEIPLSVREGFLLGAREERFFFFVDTKGTLFRVEFSEPPGSAVVKGKVEILDRLESGIAHPGIYQKGTLFLVTLTGVLYGFHLR